MVERQTNVAEFTAGLQNQAFAYERQFHIWLGVAAAGGAVSVMTLCSSLPAPSAAFEFFQPSLWCFLFGMSAAAGSLFVLARKIEALGAHYAHAENRNQYANVIQKMPVAFHSAPSEADRLNAERNQMIKSHDREHQRAEMYWNKYEKLRNIWRLIVLVSAALVFGGFALPLVRTTFFNVALPGAAGV